MEGEREREREGGRVRVCACAHVRTCARMFLCLFLSVHSCPAVTKKPPRLAHDCPTSPSSLIDLSAKAKGAAGKGGKKGSSAAGAQVLRVSHTPLLVPA